MCITKWNEFIKANETMKSRAKEWASEQEIECWGERVEWLKLEATAKGNDINIIYTQNERTKQWTYALLFVGRHNISSCYFCATAQDGLLCSQTNNTRSHISILQMHWWLTLLSFCLSLFARLFSVPFSRCLFLLCTVFRALNYHWIFTLCVRCAVSFRTNFFVCVCVFRWLVRSIWIKYIQANTQHTGSLLKRRHHVPFRSANTLKIETQHNPTLYAMPDAWTILNHRENEGKKWNTVHR